MIDIPGVGDLSNMGSMVDKLKDRIKFPASKDDISKTAGSMPDIPDQVKQMISNKLPNKVYQNIDEVKKELGM